MRPALTPVRHPSGYYSALAKRAEEFETAARINIVLTRRFRDYDRTDQSGIAPAPITPGAYSSENECYRKQTNLKSPAN